MGTCRRGICALPTPELRLHSKQGKDTVWTVKAQHSVAFPYNSLGSEQAGGRQTVGAGRGHRVPTGDFLPGFTGDQAL